MDSVIVKNNKKLQAYQRDKLTSSLIATCQSLHMPIGAAKVTAEKVATKVEIWLAKKPEVTSADIRRKAAEALVAYNAEAAYMYKQKRLVA